MKGKVIINGKELIFEVLRSKRKSITAKIRHDGVVIINAPTSFTVENAADFIKKHHRWLENNFDKATKQASVEKNYSERSTLHYLGKEYSLRIIQDNINSVDINDNEIIVRCESKDMAETLIINWYNNKAIEKYNELLPPIVEKFKKYNVAPTRVNIRDMRSRWGSCSNKGNISLNLNLVKLPENCIRLVMIHEMCHLIYFDHQAGFHSLMNEMMPDWKFWSKQLAFK